MNTHYTLTYNGDYKRIENNENTWSAVLLLYNHIPCNHSSCSTSERYSKESARNLFYYLLVNIFHR